MKNKFLSARGFSLLELLICFVIIAILTASAIPYYLNAVQNTRNTEAVIWWGQVKRFPMDKNTTRQRADSIENKVNNNGKLKYFTLKIICREKEDPNESCWEGELHLKDSSQHIQYYLTTQKNLQELLCVPLNGAGDSFCQNQSSQDKPLDYTVDGKTAYLIRY